ncbi:MAG: hypothetical protein IJ680_00470, partial [Paludibacteraceae bacterium]|nr:hypothetical protein [Paludibacteraceae bacterium]
PAAPSASGSGRAAPPARLLPSAPRRPRLRPAPAQKKEDEATCVAPPRMFSQRNNPYCELLQSCAAKIGTKEEHLQDVTVENAIFVLLTHHKHEKGFRS